jgi:Protein of unknown function (DUF2911)
MSFYMVRQFLITLAFLAVFNIEADGQSVLSEKRKSPLEMTNYKFKDTYIKITYGRPYKRGREIFGNLVPYGKVWRTGANEATEITTTKNILFSGKLLRAGTYSLFCIPKEKEWIIIINKGVGQFGSFEYDRTMDLMRITVQANNSMEVREDFIINFSPSNKPQEVMLYLWWDQTKVEVPIGILN